MESIKSVHSDFYGPLLKNIILTGGSSKFPGFVERLQKELNQISDCFIEPQITHIDDLNFQYKALEEVTLSHEFPELVVTKRMYNEMGNSKAINLF